MSASWWCSAPAAVAVDRSARAARRVDGHLADAGAGDQPRAVPDRLGPVRQVDAGLGAVRAAGLAGPVPGAALQVAVVARRDRIRRRPPVPAERVHALRRLAPVRVDGERRQRRGGAGWQRRIAAEAGDAEVDVGALVVRQQVVVGDRPVVADVVQRPDPEVGRQQAGEVPAVVQRRAAHAREHLRQDLRIGDLDRVVVGAGAQVRVVMPALRHLELPLRPVARVLGGVHPVALLEADDREPALGQVAADDGARGTAPDHEHVCAVRHGWHPDRAGTHRQARVRRTAPTGAAVRIP